MNRHELGISPISEETPAGEDIRYSTVFEELQAEVDRLSLPSAAAGSINWEKISTLATEILASSSKDILVASYFCVAQVHLTGLEGLQTGLRVFADLLENFWDTLFPQMRRIRGRIAAIEWWVEKCEVAIRLKCPQPISEPARELILDQCRHIEQLFAQYLPDACPDLHAMIQAIHEIPSASTSDSGDVAAPGPVTATVPEPSLSPAPQQPTASTPPRENPPAMSSETAAVKSLDALLFDLRQVAATMLEEDRRNPLPYSLLRFSIWSVIEALPPAVDGKTLIPAPQPQIATIVRNLFSQGDWGSLLTAAEYQLSEYIFWLDLNRFSAIALEKLGSEYQKASDCLARETAFFMTRFPGLAALKFSNGTPFADAETIEWLKSISFGSTDMSIELPQTGGGGDNEPISAQINDAMQQAIALFKEKNLIGAVTLFQHGMRNTASARQKMLWRMALCRFLINSRNAALAVPHFDQILEDIAVHRLEEWDPDFTLQGLKIVWSGLQKVSDSSVHERAARVLHQITRIDPVEALRIGK